MFSLFQETESPQLTKAKALADKMAEQHNRTHYVVKLCDQDFDVTAKTQAHYVYKAEPEPKL